MREQEMNKEQSELMNKLRLLPIDLQTDLPSFESQADNPKDKAKIKEALIFYELKVNALRIEGATGLLGLILNQVTNIMPGFSDMTMFVNIVNAALENNLQGKELIDFILDQLRILVNKDTKWYELVKKKLGKKLIGAIESAPYFKKFGGMLIQAKKETDHILLLEKAYETGDISSVGHLLNISQEDKEYYASGTDVLLDSLLGDIDALVYIDLIKNLFDTIVKKSTEQENHQPNSELPLKVLDLKPTINKLNTPQKNNYPEKAVTIKPPKKNEFINKMLGNMLDFVMRIDRSNYPNYTKEDLAIMHQGQIDKEIARDPSMAYFYSPEYQQIQQNMYGGGVYYSTMNKLREEEMISKGTEKVFENSIDNEILLEKGMRLRRENRSTIDELIRDPRFKDRVENIAGKEAYRQLYTYNNDLFKGFEEKSPLNERDRSLLEETEELVHYFKTL